MANENEYCAKNDDVRSTVRDGYAQIAKQGKCCSSSCCGANDPKELARSIGYADEDLSELPESANMGLSCGNPTFLAGLRPGEVVLDMGSGGGLDVFVAARKVGEKGRVIGVDMTPEMIDTARKNAEVFSRKTGLSNTEFRLGEIEHLPLADNSVNVIISNCVINLSPEKEQVWTEMARVLQPGGRIAVSDLALLKPLPPGLKKQIESLVGCVAGAVLIDNTENMARMAGFTDIKLKRKDGYIESMTEWNDPLFKKIVSGLPSGESLGDYVTSLEVTAKKT